MKISTELHESFLLREAIPMIEELIGLSSIRFYVLDEHDENWVEAAEDMTVGDFRVLANDGRGRIEGSMPGGGTSVDAPEPELV